MAKTHLHFLIWAAEGKSEAGFSGVTHVDIIAETEAKALRIAQERAPGRRYYWVNNITEHHDHSEERSR